jgi:hypothetical protein
MSAPLNMRRNKRPIANSRIATAPSTSPCKPFSTPAPSANPTQQISTHIRVTAFTEPIPQPANDPEASGLQQRLQGVIPMECFALFTSVENSQNEN